MTAPTEADATPLPGGQPPQWGPAAPWPGTRAFSVRRKRTKGVSGRPVHAVLRHLRRHLRGSTVNTASDTTGSETEYLAAIRSTGSASSTEKGALLSTSVYFLCPQYKAEMEEYLSSN